MPRIAHNPKPTRAGVLLRRWRTVQTPRLSAGDAARRLNVSAHALYRIETGARAAPDPVKKALVEAGICTYDDFFADPACARCGQPGAVRACTERDCPNRVSA